MMETEPRELVEAVEAAEAVEADEPEAQESQTRRPISQFVHDHPAMTIAGGIALGVLAAALVPKRSRTFVTEKSSALADAVSAAGLALYRETLERAESAGDGIRDMAERLGQAGSEKKKSASEDEESAGGFDLADTLASLVRQLRGRLRD